MLQYVSLQNLQQSSEAEVTLLKERYFHFYHSESKSSPSISLSAEHLHALVTGWLG